MSVGAWTKLSSPAAQGFSTNPQRIFAKTVGQNCPGARSRIQRRFAFGRGQRCSRASAFSEEKLKHAGASGDEQFASARSSGNYEARRLLQVDRLTPNVCLPTP